MKRTILFALLIIGCLPGTVLAGSQRVAVVDMERIMREYRNTLSAQQEIERQQAEILAELEKIKVTIASLERDFEAARENARQKGLVKEEAEARLKTAEEKLLLVKEQEILLDTTRKQRSKDLMDRGLQMRRHFRDEIQKAVSDYAGKKGIDLVLDSSQGLQEWRSTVMHAGSELDISAEIIKILNSDSQKQGPAR